jgi:ATP sulfurylase
MASTTCELIWTKSLLTELGVSIELPINMYCDNKSAIHIAANPVFHERTKHIEIDCHYIREKIQKGEICTPFTKSQDQLADALTKGLSCAQFKIILNKWGCFDIHSPLEGEC